MVPHMTNETLAVIILFIAAYTIGTRTTSSTALAVLDGIVAAILAILAIKIAW